MAIESSAVTASVAIVTDNTVTAEYTINYKLTHSQTLMPMIQEICRLTETDVNTIDIFSVSVGPGSFTGLRIGVATGKGLALATNKKMIAVPTLKAIAYNAYGSNKTICTIMDARRQHLYSGIYKFDENNKLNTVREQNLISFEDLVSELNTINQEILFIGDGIEVAREYIDENLKCKYQYAPAHINTQRAASVAMLALDMYNDGEIIDADEMVPDYLRPSQAEREKNKNV